jgi:hypothetical protein
MANNMTVADLGVKSLALKRRSGSSWVNAGGGAVIAGTQYKLEITFGNMAVKITYDDEQYRKDLVNIRIVGMGFKAGNSYFDKSKIVFYTNGSYSTPVAYSEKSRLICNLASFEPHHSDVLFVGHLKFAPGVGARPGSSLAWDCGIYASVRNRVWRKMTSTSV